MQKAAASAQTFGVSLEWLGAYIATISEKTRQAPESIGTALNSIMSRLRNIKEKGYNEEDVTQINDVAKALATVDVILLDEENNWRDMSDILTDVANKWDGLDGKTQAYIATTMAGTRLQNYFLTLMNDMAKAQEGNSRAVELYEGALLSAGTTSQKFAIWQESVEAAQNRLTAALEDFYALLSADWMKGFYNGMAGLVGIMTAGTEAMRGWNIIIPVVGIALIAMTAVIYKMVTAIHAANGAIGIMNVLTGGALPAILAALGLVAGVVTAVVGSVKQATEAADYSDTIDKLTNHIENVTALKDEYEKLAGKEELTRSESERMNTILERLSSTSVQLSGALRDSTGEFKDQAEVVKELNGYLYENAVQMNNLKQVEAKAAFKDTSSLTDAQEKYRKAARKQDFLREFEQYRQDSGIEDVEQAFWEFYRSLIDMGLYFDYGIGVAVDKTKSGIVETMNELIQDGKNWFGFGGDPIDIKLMSFELDAAGVFEGAKQELDRSSRVLSITWRSSRRARSMPKWAACSSSRWTSFSIRLWAASTSSRP